MNLYTKNNNWRQLRDAILNILVPTTVANTGMNTTILDLIK